MEPVACDRRVQVEPDGTRVYWQFLPAVQPAFQPHFFDDDWLARNGCVTNSPSAGRGAAMFLTIEQHDLVLRHYRRGGMVRMLSNQSYFWTGIDNTRAMREFNVLRTLEKAALPAPVPYACEVKRKGQLYTASLITRFLPGSTLAERVCTAKLAPMVWRAIGECIARFHCRGVNHRDLNAHNILIENQRDIFLIDFDRATVTQQSLKNPRSGNLARLKRSLEKIISSGPAHYDDDCWQALLNGYDDYDG